jgi:hypothetical protein
VARSNAATPADYIAELDPVRAAEVSSVRALVNGAIAPGYVERMAWGMISWDVPLELSGPTYNQQPLSYVALAAQKNHLALYLNCVDAGDASGERLRQVFEAAGKKFDMGRSCLRFSRADDLAADAVAAEIASTTPEQYVARMKASRSRA